MDIVLCQINTTVGDFGGNSQQVIDIANQHAKEILVFPELTIPGYPVLDLVENSIFVSKQLCHLDNILSLTAETDNLIIVGYIEPNKGPGRPAFNSAAVCYKGEIIYNYRKRLLPSYDVFDETRYFEPGTEMGLFHFKGKRIGIVICEDLWYENSRYRINPAKELFDANADFVISINGSPSVVGKYAEKVEMIKRISSKYALPIVYVNQVGGNDDIVFDGNSFAVNKRGVIVHKSAKFVPDISEISVDKLDFHAVGVSTIGMPHNDVFASNAQFFFEQAVCGVRDYVNKCGFKGAIIGESGGIDSAVVTAIAATALGPKNVIGVTMPSEYSSEGSYKDSELLCKNLGVRLHTLQIKNIFSTVMTSFNGVFTGPEFGPGIAEENAQARIRGLILMTYSNRYGYLVLATGNKSELSVGYSTLYGDMCGGLMPISGLYKMEVYDVASYYNALTGAENIPGAIIAKAPSAELAPGQKDTDSLPEYPILDKILKYYIEGDVLPDNEKEECQAVVRENYEATQKVLRLIKKAEFKRRQGAIGIKMHRKDFGFGRRIPIAQAWAFE